MTVRGWPQRSQLCQLGAPIVVPTCHQNAAPLVGGAVGASLGAGQKNEQLPNPQAGASLADCGVPAPRLGAFEAVARCPRTLFRARVDQRTGNRDGAHCRARQRGFVAPGPSRSEFIALSQPLQPSRARAVEFVPTWRSPQHSGAAGRGTRMLSRRRSHLRKPTTYEPT